MAPETGPRRFAFVFPLASGHVNPSLPVSRGLVALGHEVHYLCFEQMRPAIEDTGAHLHLTPEYQLEFFKDPSLGLMEIYGRLLEEHGLGKQMTDFVKLQHVVLERQLPGALRFLRHLQPHAVVCCPLVNREAAHAARLLRIPFVPLLTIAGPGSMASAHQQCLEDAGLDVESFGRELSAFEPDGVAVQRLNEAYGLGLKPGFPLPLGHSDAFRGMHACIVTTSEDLQDAVPADLAAAFAAEGSTSFIAVGPLLDHPGAQRMAGHKDGVAEVAAAGHGGRTSDDGIVARVQAARAVGRGVVLVSLGTVLTGDAPLFGWEGRKAGPDGEPSGLTGRELCRGAWGGAFDAFGSASEEDGPLLLVSLGPQADALGPLQPPPNAICLPALPQVDVLTAGVDLFLTHGGQNSFTEALSHATPVVVCPGFGDQVVNARKAVDLGVGLKIDRPEPPRGAEEEACARYRTAVARALSEAWRAPKMAAAAGACAGRLRAAGGVPRAVEIVLSAAGVGPRMAKADADAAPPAVVALAGA